MRRTLVRGLPIPTPEQLDKTAFGSIFADMMYKRYYRGGVGWDAGNAVPFENLSLPPQSSCLHYCTECFEGLKAYRGVDGTVRLFRPDLNGARMARSMERLGMPVLPPKEFCDALGEFVRRVERWVPPTIGHSLYLRPCAIALSDVLRVAPPTNVLFFVIATPVGNYFAGGVKPITLHVEDKYRRTCRGGTGAFKVGANYANTLEAQAKAAAGGCGQCLWLGEGDVLQEVGAMNIMVVLREGERTTLATPPLDGTILEGVTRSSILELAASYEGVTVSERIMTIQDIIHAQRENRLLEMFACGTAATVAPVNAFTYSGVSMAVPAPEDGITMRVRRDLLDIQHGVIPSPWTEIVA